MIIFKRMVNGNVLNNNGYTAVLDEIDLEKINWCKAHDINLRFVKLDIPLTVKN